MFKNSTLVNMKNSLDFSKISTPKVMETLQSITSLNELEQYINLLNKAYINQLPITNDAEYDYLYEYLQMVKPESAIFKTVGHKPEKNAVILPVWMGSLDKVKPSTKTLTKFINDTCGYVISEKLDGVSLLLSREKGVWKCFTRGNGQIGQDVTSTILASIDIPDLSGIDDKVHLLIRGEFILPRHAATSLNTTKNLRTIINGVVNAKVPKLDVLQLAQFVAYSIPLSNLTSLDQFLLLKKYGFNIPKLTNTTTVLTDLLLEKTLVSWRSSSDYDIDGIVISKNRLEDPVINKNPKMTVAFKMALESQTRTTTVLDVEWNCSKDGYLKPVVMVETVVIDGTNINRVTGNNAKFLHTNKIGKGSVIKIIRSGDVIPKIVEVLKPCSKIAIPNIDCTWSETKTDLIATDITNNHSKSLLYFIKTVGIKYVNSSICNHLIDIDITTPEQLVSMSKEDLLKLPNMGEKSTTKIYNSIHEALATVNPLSLLISLNLLGRNMGVTRLHSVVDKLGLDYLVDNMDKLDPKTLQLIDGFSYTLATQLSEGLSKLNESFKNTPIIYQYFKDAVARYHKDTSKTVKTKPSNKFNKFNLVFTGFRDKQLEEDITNKGGKISDTINKSVTHVVTPINNTKMSSKLKKAESLKIPIITRESLISLMN